MKRLKHLSLLILSPVFCLPSYSDGLLGERHGGLSYQFGDIQGIDLWGVSGTVNLPAILDDEAGSNFGMDGIISFSHMETDDFGLSDFLDDDFLFGDDELEEVRTSVSAKQFGLGAVFFSRESKKFRPYIGFLVGYADVNASGFGSDSSFVYQVQIGGEILVGNDITIIPFIGYADATDIPNGDEEVFGIEVSRWISERFNVGARFETASELGIDIDLFSLVGRIRL